MLLLLQQLSTLPKLQDEVLPLTTGFSFLNVTTPLLFTVATFLLLEVQIRLDGLTTPEEVFTCSFVFFPAATFLVVPVIVSFGWLEVTLVVVLFFSQIAI